MFGYSISTGGSNVALAGWKVHANAGATPLGIGMGMSSWWTWFRLSLTGAFTVGFVPFSRVIELAFTRKTKPSMPAQVISMSLWPFQVTVFSGRSGGRRIGLPRVFSAFGTIAVS
jgi:hypothetical protein